MKQLRIILSLFITFILFSENLSSQESLGLVNGNYSGVDGVWINPATMTNFHQYLDIRLAAFQLTVENDYLYIGANEYRARDVFSRTPVFPTYIEAYGSQEYELSGFNHYQNGQSKDVYLGSRIAGPGFMLTDGDYSYGFSVQARTAVSLHDVPESVANFGYIGLGYEPQHGIEYDETDFHAAGMAWMEYAVSLAKILEDRYYNRISAGMTMKYLSGATGFYLQGTNMQYNMLDRSNLDILDMNAEVGMSIPMNYSNNSFPDGNGIFKGRGVSFDIGFTLLHKDKNYHRRNYRRLCQQHYDSYVYRLGISLLDIGFVRFNENTIVHEYSGVDYLWENINTYQYENISFLMTDLSNRFFRSPNETYKQDRMVIYTPAAISVQGDYSFDSDIYLGGVWIHPLRMGKGGIRRPAQLAIVPRYEKRYFEVAMPFSMYDYEKPRLGLSVRFYAVTIGTEKLGAYTGLFDFTGMDFYFSVKWSFEKGNCPGKGRKYGCDNVSFK